jgi:hypothetical protein
MGIDKSEDFMAMQTVGSTILTWGSMAGATNLDNYAHFVAFTDYESRASYFHAFKLLELSTNSSILAGKPRTYIHSDREEGRK